MESHLCVWHHAPRVFLRLDSIRHCRVNSILQQVADSIQCSALILNSKASPDLARIYRLIRQTENRPLSVLLRVTFLYILQVTLSYFYIIQISFITQYSKYIFCFCGTKLFCCIVMIEINMTFLFNF